jgi:predicted RNA-binding Zn-ribbon protein involved in translation (DUF1610 family)
LPLEYSGISRKLGWLVARENARQGTPATLINDAQIHRLKVRPIDVNSSEWNCTLEMEQNQGVLAKKVEASLTYTCPLCKQTISPSERTRIDWDQVQCNKCNGIFLKDERQR